MFSCTLVQLIIEVTMALNTEQKLEFPYEFYELEPELEAQLMRDFSGKSFS